jgi:hypothetical protein
MPPCRLGRLSRSQFRLAIACPLAFFPDALEFSLRRGLLLVHELARCLVPFGPGLFTHHLGSKLGPFLDRALTCVIVGFICCHARLQCRHKRTVEINCSNKPLLFFSIIGKDGCTNEGHRHSIRRRSPNHVFKDVCRPYGHRSDSSKYLAWKFARIPQDLAGTFSDQGLAIQRPTRGRVPVKELTDLSADPPPPSN